MGIYEIDCLIEKWMETHVEKPVAILVHPILHDALLKEMAEEMKYMRITPSILEMPKYRGIPIRTSEHVGTPELI